MASIQHHFEEPGDRRLASYIIDQIGDLGIDVAVYRIGLEAEEGWEVIAGDSRSPEHWRIESNQVLDAAVELAVLAGIDVYE